MINLEMLFLAFFASSPEVVTSSHNLRPNTPWIELI